MAEFAERLKKISAEVEYRRNHPDMVAWENNMMDVLRKMKKGVLKEFEKWASKGYADHTVQRIIYLGYHGNYEIFFNDYLPKFKEFILKNTEDIFKPYGIKVHFAEPEDMMTVRLHFELE